ncbi:MAG: hypothetical protein ACSHXY_01275 [Alphaproteobacteria bacterium]
MTERVYPRAGFANWMIAAAVCALAFLLLGILIISFDMLFRVVDGLYISLGMSIAFGLPVCACLSALMNWGYERRYNEEIYTRWYTHPNNWHERSICVLGGALMIALLPLVFFLGWSLLLWLVFL